MILLVFSTAGLAQIYEFDAHAGGFFPLKWLKTDRLEAQGMYGGRMGVYSTENIQFDAAMSYANHFVVVRRIARAPAGKLSQDGGGGAPALRQCVTSIGAAAARSWRKLDLSGLSFVI